MDKSRIFHSTVTILFWQHFESITLHCQQSPLQYTVKQSTKMCNLLQNIATNRSKRVVVNSSTHIQTYLAKNQFTACFVHTLILIGWNYTGVTPYTGGMSLAAKQVCLGPVKHATSTDFVVKSRTTFYFLQQLFENCNKLICCKTGLIVGGKMHNIAIQLVLQQCCKTSFILTSCL